jgi:hypothetical protein
MFRQDDREEGHQRRGAAGPGVLRPGLKGKLKPTKARSWPGSARCPTVLRAIKTGESPLAAEADRAASKPLGGARRGQGDLQARRGAQRGIQHLHQGRGGRRRTEPDLMDGD